MLAEGVALAEGVGASGEMEIDAEHV